MTSDKAKELFFDALLLGTSKVIEAQESRGQNDLVASTNLPKEGDWEELQAMGIVKGEDVDNLFCSATLPEGWTKVATDHSMWSEIRDHRGMKRASIFYKAAFYDEKASIQCLSNRFSLSEYNKKCDKNGIQFVAEDLCVDKAIKIFEPVYYATLDGVLGAIYKGKFYSKTSGSGYDAVFVDCGIETQSATRLTKHEFHESCQNRNTTRYDLITAMKSLAKADAIAFIETLPKDKSQWTEAFDFPAV